MTSWAVAVGAAVFALLTRATNVGLPKMAVTSVTVALMIATKTGVSNFFSGFFSRSGAGGVRIAPLGAVRSFEGGEAGFG